MFSYTIAHDYGSAPNPFWGICTLTICKPVTRRVAKIGDWVAGLRENSIVYAMRITDKKTFADYDEYCRQYLPEKIPDWSSHDFRRRVGDCIYDYLVSNPPKLRRSIHSKKNVTTDIGGLYALLSNDFYYFGSQPIILPANLKPIIHKRGHKSDANAPYFESFINWIRVQHKAHNNPIADPELRDELADPKCVQSKCAKHDRKEAELDEQQANECS